jgi:hypothetical protein
VPDHTARLLVATPVLRRSWLVAVVVTLLLGVGVGRTATPLLMLAVAPMLPLAGVAVAFGPGLNPMHEVAVVAPLHSFRLLMVRAITVLATTLPPAAAASLAMPEFGTVTVGWLLPALALTSFGLALMPRLGPVAASALVGGGWVAALLAGRLLTRGVLFPLTTAGQLAAGVAALAAIATLVAVRDSFDASRRPPSRLSSRLTSHPSRPIRPIAGRLP